MLQSSHHVVSFVVFAAVVIVGTCTAAAAVAVLFCFIDRLLHLVSKRVLQQQY